MTGAPQDPPPAAVTCSSCGTTTADGTALTWSTSWGPRGRTWSCEACTRQHLRAMEARLDEEHW